jgi:hypothetical protein
MSENTQQIEQMNQQILDTEKFNAEASVEINRLLAEKERLHALKLKAIEERVKDEQRNRDAEIQMIKEATRKLGKELADFDVKEMEDIELSSIGLTRVRVCDFISVGRLFC